MPRVSTYWKEAGPFAGDDLLDDLAEGLDRERVGAGLARRERDDPRLLDERAHAPDGREAHAARRAREALVPCRGRLFRHPDSSSGPRAGRTNAAVYPASRGHSPVPGKGRRTKPASVWCVIGLRAASGHAIVAAGRTRGLGSHGHGARSRGRRRAGIARRRRSWCAPPPCAGGAPREPALSTRLRAHRDRLPQRRRGLPAPRLHGQGARCASTSRT